MSAGEWALLLELVGRLAEPQLGLDVRLNLVAQMRRVLNHERPEQVQYLINGIGTAARTALVPVAQPW